MVESWEAVRYADVVGLGRGGGRENSLEFLKRWAVGDALIAAIGWDEDSNLPDHFTLHQARRGFEPETRPTSTPTDDP